MTSQGKIAKIDSVFAQIFRKKKWERKLALYGIFEKWPEVVGRDIAERTSPSSIRGTVLWIEVSDSVWMQQLHLQKQGMLARINEELAESGVFSDIRFQLNLAAGVEELPAVKSSPSPLRVIPPGKRQAFERMLATIGDGDLRTRLLALWEKAQRRIPDDSREP